MLTSSRSSGGRCLSIRRSTRCDSGSRTSFMTVSSAPSAARCSPRARGRRTAPDRSRKRCSAMRRAATRWRRWRSSGRRTRRECSSCPRTLRSRRRMRHGPPGGSTCRTLQARRARSGPPSTALRTSLGSHSCDLSGRSSAVISSAREAIGWCSSINTRRTSASPSSACAPSMHMAPSSDRRCCCR